MVLTNVMIAHGASTTLDRILANAWQDTKVMGRSRAKVK